MLELFQTYNHKTVPKFIKQSTETCLLGSINFNQNNAINKPTQPSQKRSPSKQTPQKIAVNQHTDVYFIINQVVTHLMSLGAVLRATQNQRQLPAATQATTATSTSCTSDNHPRKYQMRAARAAAIAPTIVMMASRRSNTRSGRVLVPRPRRLPVSSASASGLLPLTRSRSADGGLPLSTSRDSRTASA